MGLKWQSFKNKAKQYISNAAFATFFIGAGIHAAGTFFSPNKVENYISNLKSEVAQSISPSKEKNVINQFPEFLQRNNREIESVDIKRTPNWDTTIESFLRIQSDEVASKTKPMFILSPDKKKVALVKTVNKYNGDGTTSQSSYVKICDDKGFPRSLEMHFPSQDYHIQNDDYFFWWRNSKGLATHFDNISNEGGPRGERMLLNYDLESETRVVEPLQKYLQNGMDLTVAGWGASLALFLAGASVINSRRKNFTKDNRLKLSALSAVATFPAVHYGLEQIQAVQDNYMFDVDKVTLLCASYVITEGFIGLTSNIKSPLSRNAKDYFLGLRHLAKPWDSKGTAERKALLERRDEVSIAPDLESWIEFNVRTGNISAALELAEEKAVQESDLHLSPDYAPQGWLTKILRNMVMPKKVSALMNTLVDIADDKKYQAGWDNVYFELSKEVESEGSSSERGELKGSISESDNSKGNQSDSDKLQLMCLHGIANEVHSKLTGQRKYTRNHWAKTVSKVESDPSIETKLLGESANEVRVVDGDSYIASKLVFKSGSYKKLKCEKIFANYLSRKSQSRKGLEVLVPLYVGEKENSLTQSISKSEITSSSPATSVSIRLEGETLDDLVKRNPKKSGKHFVKVAKHTAHLHNILQGASDKVDKHLPEEDYQAKIDAKIEDPSSKITISLQHLIKKSYAPVVKSFRNLPKVANLDGHSENWYVSVDDNGQTTYTKLDSETSSTVPITFDLANLINYSAKANRKSQKRILNAYVAEARKNGQEINSDEFLLGYYNSVIHRSLSLSSAWSKPNRKDMHEKRTHILDRAIDAIQNIKADFADYYQEHRRDYFALERGLKSIRNSYRQTMNAAKHSL